MYLCRPSQTQTNTNIQTHPPTCITDSWHVLCYRDIVHPKILPFSRVVKDKPQHSVLSALSSPAVGDGEVFMQVYTAVAPGKKILFTALIQSDAMISGIDSVKAVEPCVSEYSVVRYGTKVGKADLEGDKGDRMEGT